MAEVEREALQLDLFSEAAGLRRLDPDRTMARFCLMALQPDLSGGVNLARGWRRIGSASRVFVSHHEDRDRAMDALAGHLRAECCRYVPRGR